MLSSHIRGHTRIGGHTGNGGGVDDGAATCLEHHRDLVAHGQEHAGGVHTHGAVPVLHRLLVQRGGRRQDAGIVEGDVDGAVLLDGRVHQVLHRGVVRDIGPHELGCAAGLSDDLHGLLRAVIDVTYHDGGPGLGKLHRGGPADTRGPAGDDHDLVLDNRMKPASSTSLP